MQAALFDAALKLPPEDRLELLDRLWASLIGDGDGPALSRSDEEAEVTRRLDEIDLRGVRGRPWPEVRAEIEARHRR